MGQPALVISPFCAPELSSVKWALSTNSNWEVEMRSAAGPDAWEPAGGSTGTRVLGEPGGAGVLPRCRFLGPPSAGLRSVRVSVPRPGGMPEWAGLRAG